MKAVSQRPKQKSAKRRTRATHGRDNMTSNTGRKDYYVANALEITPHPNQELRAVLGQPVMDRRFKYSVFESSLVANSATSATPLSLVTINQGTTDITRTGDRVRVKRFWLSAKVYGAAAATGPTVSRILVVLWNPVGAAAVNAPIAGQILNMAATYGPYASYSRDFGDSFQVVYDGVFSTNPVSATSENELIHIDRALTVDMEFSAGATTPCTNNFYLFHLTEAAANQPAMNFSSTIWYEDLDA